MGELIRDRAALQKAVAARRAAGQRIVFTNGAFDLLHVGHLRTLQGARALADCLVVAINSDASIRKAKGSSRPIVPEAERAELLCGLSCVDYVTVFDDATVDALLLLLKPDIHAKGTDYTVETVPERATVLSYGGQIAITGDPKDHSTTAMADKMREKLKR